MRLQSIFFRQSKRLPNLKNNLYEKEGSRIDYFFMSVLLISAVGFDVKTYRIPNFLNGAGCLSGILYSTVMYGGKGFLHSTAGILLPVICLFILFGFRIIGAGDVKLLSAIGSFLFADVVKVIALAMIFTALYGLIICAVRILRRGRLHLTKLHLSIPIAAGTAAFVLGGMFYGI